VRLNYDHAMAGGQVFRNPSLIDPGWQLLIPLRTIVGPSQHGTVGHHLGHPTADEFYRRRHPAATASRAERSGGPQRRRVLVAPSLSSTAGAASASSVIDSGAASARTTQGQPGHQASASAEPADSALHSRVAFVSGMLAGAVLSNLARLRRIQRQHRRRGRRISLPAEREVQEAERRLRAVVPAEQLKTLRDALACLEASVLGTGQELPDIVGLHVTPDALEVLLAVPAPEAPPPPFVVSPGRQGMCWQLDLPAVATAPVGHSTPSSPGLTSLTCHLLPGLITAGATANGYLLLDLESLQVAGCDGPHVLIERFITTVATELATGQWSGWYDLILVGCDELADLGRAEHCSTVEEAIDLLTARQATVAHRIAERAPADVRELRLAEPHNEDWGLTVLVSQAEPSAKQMARLLQLAEDGHGGIAALVAGDPESDDGRMAPTVIQLAPDPELPDGIIANVVPLQITVWPHALSVAEYEAIGRLLATATDPNDVGQEENPYLAYGAPPWIPQAFDLRPWSDAHSEDWGDRDGAAADTASDDDMATGQSSTPADSWVPADGWAPQQVTPPAPAMSSPLEVKMLGQFAVTGAAGRLQPKQAELVLALALAAPVGLSNSALCSMLGADADHPKPADAIRQIITRTRRRLGLASDGREYIIHAGNGQYVLHPDAVLDWSRFRGLVQSGRVEDLRMALSLINGQPFTGSYFWWIDVPLVETVRAEIVDAADALAEFELAIDMPRAAAKAARTGLMAEPSAEQLWRAVMRAEHAAGNLAGVAEAWRRCLDAIADIAPEGEPHPDTATLYRELTLRTHQRVEVR
jgi:DNA-binding SARP family transcriptional activator